MTPYQILGVKPTAGDDEIRRAYHRLAKQLHPDMNGTDEPMRRLNEAYQALKPAKRSNVDGPARGLLGATSAAFYRRLELFALWLLGLLVLKFCLDQSAVLYIRLPEALRWWH